MLPKARITLRSRLLPVICFLEAAVLIQVGITEEKKCDDYKGLQLFITLALILLEKIFANVT